MKAALIRFPITQKSNQLTAADNNMAIGRQTKNALTYINQRLTPDVVQTHVVSHIAQHSSVIPPTTTTATMIRSKRERGCLSVMIEFPLKTKWGYPHMDTLAFHNTKCWFSKLGNIVFPYVLNCSKEWTTQHVFLNIQLKQLPVLLDNVGNWSCVKLQIPFKVRHNVTLPDN